MRRIFSGYKKLKPNTVIMFNIIFIMVVFGGISKYMGQKYKVKTEQNIDGIKYTMLINSYKYSKDSIMNINLIINNRKREKRELEIKRAILFNVEIIKDGELIFKRDYADKLSGKKNFLKIGSYGKVTASYEWNMSSDDETKKIDKGKYVLHIYSRDLKFDMSIPFEIFEEGL